MKIDELVNLAEKEESTHAQKAIGKKVAAEEPKTDESSKVDFINPETLLSQYDSKTKVSKIKKESYEKIECIICYGRSEEMMAAKCGHIACAGCWLA